MRRRYARHLGIAALVALMLVWLPTLAYVLFGGQVDAAGAAMITFCSGTIFGVGLLAAADAA